jgi:hypothetical protein
MTDDTGGQQIDSDGQAQPNVRHHDPVGLQVRLKIRRPHLDHLAHPVRGRSASIGERTI